MSDIMRHDVLKRNLADGGMVKCMNALADKVRKQEYTLH